MAHLQKEYVYTSILVLSLPTAYLATQLYKHWTGPVTSDKDHANQKTLQDDEIRKKTSGLRLNDDSTDTMTLPDGRTLCFAHYGASSGPAVFYLHGGGDARKGGVFFDEPGERLGTRIIACDRPGIGGSSAHPNRTALDHVKDIQCLAKHLDISEFYVLGVSGGGPYALACASAIPAKQLKGVAIVCGIGPLSINLAYAGWAMWIMLKAHLYCPGLVSWYTRTMMGRFLKQPDEKLREMYKQQAQPRRFSLMNMSEKDAQLMRADKFVDLAIRGNREYFKQSMNTMTEEWLLWVSDLGFKVEDIRSDLPVHLWYGKQDRGVPPRVGEEIAARLGGRTTLTVEDEGHLSLVMNWRETILKNLLGSM